MKQMTLSTEGFDRYSKTTRRAAFLSEMDRVVLWSALCALIEPVYPKAGSANPRTEGIDRHHRGRDDYQCTASTKNQSKARDPVKHQTNKGNQWYFGMKAHIGVDSKSKLIHSVVATPANEHDKQSISDLLHANEKNGNRLYVVAALANLFMARHHLLRLLQERFG